MWTKMHVKSIGQICSSEKFRPWWLCFYVLHPLFTNRLTSDILTTGELKTGKEKQGQPPPFSVTEEITITLNSM